MLIRRPFLEAIIPAAVVLFVVLLFVVLFSFFPTSYEFYTIENNTNYSNMKALKVEKELYRHRKREKEFTKFIHFIVQVSGVQEEFFATIPRRLLSDRSDPLESVRDFEFVRDHGMSKFAFRHILSLVQDELEPRPGNIHALHPALKLSCFLRFLRCGSFHRCIGANQDTQVSQAVVCRYINKIARLFARRHSDYVKFPNKDERLEIAHEFSSTTGFPPVICGIIDGTHIEIEKPRIFHPPPEKFFNRKGYYSLNMMCIVDNRMKIRYFTCRHAGSAHDAKIFGQSSVRQALLSEFDTSNPVALIGDEAYPTEDVMLPPVRKVQLRKANPEMKTKMEAYNKIHKKTRLLVEHTIGVLKKRFPVLLYQIRSKTLENVQALVAAAVVIHNILIDIKDPFPASNNVLDDDSLREQLSRFDLEDELVVNEREKFRLRNLLISNCF